MSEDRRLIDFDSLFIGFVCVCSACRGVSSVGFDMNVGLPFLSVLQNVFPTRFIRSPPFLLFVCLVIYFVIRLVSL